MSNWCVTQSARDAGAEVHRNGWTEASRLIMRELKFQSGRNPSAWSTGAGSSASVDAEPRAEATEAVRDESERPRSPNERNPIA